MNLLNILIKGGWLMIPILICSIIAIVVIIDRYLVLAKSKLSQDFLTRCKIMADKGDKDGIVELCKIYDSPITRTLQEGILNGEESMSIKADQEIANLEKRVTILATIGGVAPMLGFMGTVTGMIRAFMQVQALGGNVNASVLAGGIWEALVTTVAGLAVGIISYIFYNAILERIKTTGNIMQSLTTIIKWK